MRQVESPTTLHECEGCPVPQCNFLFVVDALYWNSSAPLDRSYCQIESQDFSPSRPPQTHQVVTQCHPTIPAHMRGQMPLRSPFVGRICETEAWASDILDGCRDVAVMFGR